MNLFEKIKEKKYNIILKYLKNNTEVNLNIQDDFNNYFIEYVIDSSDLPLIQYVLSKNVFLDILDNNGTTILYNLIKFNKIDILDLILKNDRSKIGIHILDKKDIKGRTALHYCVIFNNQECLNKLIEYNGDPYITDKNGNNIFFYSIIYKRIDLLLNLFEKFKNFRIRNTDGENLLQVSINYDIKDIYQFLITKTNINLNNKSKLYGTTALHQAIINNNNNLIDLLIKYKADLSIPDYLGNNVLHFAIMEKNSKLLLKFLELGGIDLNLTNLNGFIPLNLYLTEFEQYDDKILNKFIENSNLNIQNFNGNTSLLLLGKNNKIFELKDELEKKLINIFIKNYDGESLFDIIKDKDSLIKLVTKSFFNNLDKNSIIDWEKKCSFIKNNIKSDLLPQIKSKEDCYKKIKETINNEKRSIPRVKQIKFDISIGIALKDCFFSGFPIDTLFGLLWLHRENKRIQFVLDYPLTYNDSIENFYKSVGQNINFKMDFINSMILWTYQKIYFPDYFDYVLEQKLKSNSEIIVIPIGIETSQGAHSNILFWNRKKNILERFEPNGKNQPINFNYNPDLLDELLLQKFNKFTNGNSKFTYLKPKDYLPEVGFQMIENLENETCSEIGDPNGFCTVWCIWYSYQKSQNLEIDSKKIVEELINNIKLEGKSFKNLIRDFSKNISKYRDEYLQKVELNINQWILSNYNIEKLQKLEKLIINIIN